jgi:two-component system, response regulator PdtaR
LIENESHPPAEAPIVLIVDDEPLVRLLASDILTEAGYRVIEAMNSEEALTLIEAKPETIALVTDVRMPGEIDGFGLARLVAGRWPHIGLVITSATATPGEGDVPPDATFLPKPYQLSALVGAVRKAAERQAAVITAIPIATPE